MMRSEKQFSDNQVREALENFDKVKIDKAKNSWREVNLNISAGLTSYRFPDTRPNFFRIRNLTNGRIWLGFTSVSSTNFLQVIPVNQIATLSQMPNRDAIQIHAEGNGRIIIESCEYEQIVTDFQTTTISQGNTQITISDFISEVVVITTANTEVIYHIPINSKTLMIKERSGSLTIRFSTVSGQFNLASGNFITLLPGQSFTMENFSLNFVKNFFLTANANNTIIEIVRGF